MIIRESDWMRGYVLIVLAAVCWGTLGPVARLVFREGVGPLEVAMWRATGGSLLFILHAGAAGNLRLQRRDLLPVVAFGVVGVALFYASYQIAVDQGGAALASILLYTAPAWVALMGWLWLGESITKGKLTAVGLTIGGVAAIAQAGGGALRWSPAAVIWGLVAGWSYALYYPFGKRFFKRYAPVTLFAFSLPIGAAVLAPFVDFANKSTAAWLGLIWIAFISTYFAYLAYGYGLRRVEATRASIVATIEPVVATVLSYAWWGERMGIWGLAGAVLILSGVIFSILDKTNTTTPSA